jgi:hypothetical protein|tara:strand:+ start:313 stop:435 length:123 start_codon:yes stop_codon:yes gene_type:complete
LEKDFQRFLYGMDYEGKPEETIKRIGVIGIDFIKMSPKNG